MPREVDEKKTRKALRKLRKARQRAEAEGVELTDWEKDFVEGIDERLTKFGSAFHDPNLGRRDEALSNAQTEILRQLDKKSRGKPYGGFKTRKPLKAKSKFSDRRPSSRQIDDDIADEPEDDADQKMEQNVSFTGDSPRLRLVSGHSETPHDDSSPSSKPVAKKPFLRLVRDEIGSDSDS